MDGGQPLGIFTFSWNLVSDRVYTLFVTTNLLETWHPVTNPPRVNIPGTGTPISFSNNVSLGTNLFYKVHVSDGSE